MDDGDRSTARQVGLASQVGGSLIGPVLVGLILDVQFGWEPWGTLAGVLLGLVSCLMLLIRMSNRSK
jgi:F0F1-type ATP synthase assembly protein I